MPDPTYQLTTPVWNWRNRRQPPNSGGESYLRPPDSFGESYLSSQLGWAYRSSSGQVYNLGLIPPGGTQSIDDSFASACAAVARAQSLTQPVNPKALAQAFRAAADLNVWDKLRDWVQGSASSFWRDIPGRKKNSVTGEPVGDGKIDPSGKVIPTNPDGLVVGSPVPVWKGTLGKRFPSSSHSDVYLNIYINKDVLLSNKPTGTPGMRNILVSGVGVSLECKTSDGCPQKFRFDAGLGHDPASGFALFVSLGSNW